MSTTVDFQSVDGEPPGRLPPSGSHDELVEAYPSPTGRVDAADADGGLNCLGESVRSAENAVAPGAVLFFYENPLRASPRRMLVLTRHKSIQPCTVAENVGSEEDHQAPFWNRLSFKILNQVLLLRLPPRHFISRFKILNQVLLLRRRRQHLISVLSINILLSWQGRDAKGVKSMG